MKLILLSGKQNSGKTKTLNMLYNEIINLGGIIIDKKEILRSKDDFKCTFSYNNIKIAIFTMGDVLKECIKAIIEYSNQDILVLAYSNIFTKINLDEMARRFDYHFVIKKTVSEKKDHFITNKNDCRKILSELN